MTPEKPLLSTKPWALIIGLAALFLAACEYEEVSDFEQNNSVDRNLSGTSSYMDGAYLIGRISCDQSISLDKTCTKDILNIKGGIGFYQI